MFVYLIEDIMKLTTRALLEVRRIFCKRMLKTVRRKYMFQKDSKKKSRVGLTRHTLGLGRDRIFSAWAPRIVVVNVVMRCI